MCLRDEGGYGTDADLDFLYVDGGQEVALNRERIAVDNPEAGETITEIPGRTSDDVDRAFKAATAAQSARAETP